MDLDLIDYPEFHQSFLGTREWIDVDQNKLEYKNMQSTRSMNQIHSKHLNPQKIFSQ